MHQADLNALIRSAIYARRPDDFTSSEYYFRRYHSKRRGYQHNVNSEPVTGARWQN